MSRDLWKMTNSLDVVYPNVSHQGNQAWMENVTARMREFEIELMKRLRYQSFIWPHANIRDEITASLI